MASVFLVYPSVIDDPIPSQRCRLEDLRNNIVIGIIFIKLHGVWTKTRSCSPSSNFFAEIPWFKRVEASRVKCQAVADTAFSTKFGGIRPSTEFMLSLPQCPGRSEFKHNNFNQLRSFMVSRVEPWFGVSYHSRVICNSLLKHAGMTGEGRLALSFRSDMNCKTD